MKKILIFIVLLLLSFKSSCQISVNNLNAGYLQSLAGPGVSISNIYVNAACSLNNCAYGKFTNGLGIGISEGVILSSGSIYDAPGPNNAMNTSTNLNYSCPTNLAVLLNNLGLGPTYDVSSINFTIVPQSNNINIRYVFASEEYHEYVNSQFNDVVAFFISGPGINGWQNFTSLPGPTVVNSINNGFSNNCSGSGLGVNSNLFIDNCNGTDIQYDGYTKVLTASACDLKPNEAYHVIIAVADVFDKLWDSAIFLEKGSVTSKEINANFTLYSTCINGLLNISATASDPDMPNDWWGLMETSIEGDTSDSVTLNGGIPIQEGQNVNFISFSGLNPSKHYYIKHIISGGCYELVSEIRIPVPPISIDNRSYIKDVNGNVKKTFCLNEDVYLDGSAVNTYGNGYFLDIWEVNGGNVIWLAAQGTNGWSSGTPSWVNITSLFQNSVVFQPNKTYRIKLAINGPCGWAESLHDFTIICCENSVNSAFSIISQNSDSGELQVNLVSNYQNNFNAIEEWCLYEAPNGNTGPYNLVSCEDTPFSISIPPGQCYYLSHKIKSDCGQSCSGQTICNTGCLETCEELSSPKNLNCSYLNGLNHLSWSSVIGAAGYKIEIIAEDPDCCGQSVNNSSFALPPIVITDNFYDANFHFSCFSWTVTAICDHFIQSQKSIKSCSCLPANRSNKDENFEDRIRAEIIPNPTINNVIFYFETPNQHEILFIEVNDTLGHKIKTFENNKITNGKFEINWNVSGLAKGEYYVTFTTSNGEKITKKLLVE